jgi:hypothetical protein
MCDGMCDVRLAVKLDAYLITNDQLRDHIDDQIVESTWVESSVFPFVFAENKFVLPYRNAPLLSYK